MTADLKHDRCGFALLRGVPCSAIVHRSAIFYQAPAGYFIKDFVIFGEQVPPPAYTTTGWRETGKYSETPTLPTVAQTMYLVVALEGHDKATMNPKVVHVLLPEFAVGNCTAAEEGSEGDTIAFMKNPACQTEEALAQQCSPSTFFNPSSGRCEYRQVCVDSVSMNAGNHMTLACR